MQPVEGVPRYARRKLVVGNWKMCANRDRIAELAKIRAGAPMGQVEVVICPPFPLIHPAHRAGRGLAIGAQDCHHMDEGPFTGSVSPLTLREAGARYVIVGHSERRTAFGESDAMVQAKAAAAIGARLTPIICVGETKADRDAGRAAETVVDQVTNSLPEAFRPWELVVAYEPVWAIGSDRTPTAEEISGIHTAIRAALRDRFGAAEAAEIRILYGGAVSAANAGWISALPDVDGLLVGSRSLTADQFVPIIAAACADVPCEAVSRH